MPNELKTNPQTGELELADSQTEDGSTPDESTPDHTRSVLAGKKIVEPKRSWDSTKESGYTGRFEYEGATILIRALGDDAWAAIEEFEESLQDESDALAAEGKAIDENAALPDKAEESIEEYSRPEEDESEEGAANEPKPVKMSGPELRERRRAYRKQSLVIADKMFDFQRDIVTRTVVGWKGAPIPYSSDAIAKLPKEMIVEWAGIILEKSRLGKADAENLRRS